MDDKTLIGMRLDDIDEKSLSENDYFQIVEIPSLITNDAIFNEFLLEILRIISSVDTLRVQHKLKRELRGMLYDLENIGPFGDEFTPEEEKKVDRLITKIRDILVPLISK